MNTQYTTSPDGTKIAYEQRGAGSPLILIHGGGVFMKLDGEGRLMVSDFIRDYTGISDQVTFVGRSDHFQLWDPVCYEEKRQEALSRRVAGGMPRGGQGETG